MAKIQPPEYMQLRIELRGIEPMIWRSVVLPSRSSLSVLHRTIPDSMGWTESHLHRFDKDGLSYGPDYAWDPGFGPPLLSQNKQLKSVFAEPGEWLRYEYDFGDSWVHLVELEYWLQDSKTGKVPTCVAGARNCPPEDSGGPHGYRYLLSVLADENHEEHNSMMEWVESGYDPEEFSIKDRNQVLERRFS